MNAIIDERSPRIAALKHALTGNADARFVWLCNFEVENEWAKGFAGLPGGGVSANGALVQRLEEHGILLAESGDALITSRPIDPAFLAYLSDAGLPLAQQIVVADPQEQGTSAAVLASPETLARLRKLGGEGWWLMPMGVSRLEEAIADATGLRIAGSDANTAVKVNSKIYSRRLTDREGIVAIEGRNCERVADLHDALEPQPFAPYPLIVKEAYGVSGKGLLVLRSAAGASGLLRMLDRRAARRGDESVQLVVETFLDKRFDLNYQITVARDGAVSFDFVKQAVTENGVHKGHVIPAALSDAQHEQIRAAAATIGAALHRDGFFGVAGIDALVDAEDRVRPVLEINARLNMSTYQTRVLERFATAQTHALARLFPIVVNHGAIRFEQVLDALGPLAAPPANGEGLLITCFGTVDPYEGQRDEANGRLYTMLFAKTAARLAELDEKASAALAVFRQAGGN